MMKKKRERLDQIMVEKGMVSSRQRAQAMIMTGKVLVNGIRANKAGTPVSAYQSILLKEKDNPYVSRGGLKLHEAIQKFGIHVVDTDCLDVGAATGGFTDCLLQHGAARVFAVDVGYGQFAWKLRQDPRVTVIERTNIRYMTQDTLPCAVDIVTVDVSFISLKIVVPAVRKFMKPDAVVLALIKPQFEVGKGRVGKGGVVKDHALHQGVIEDLVSFFENYQFDVRAVIPSPILGPKGNREFIIHFRIQQ